MVLRVAIIGAESTGKTTLAQALQHTLISRGLRVHWVAEYLRDWCEERQRTPRQDEQLSIAQEQLRRVEACVDSHVCISDTTPLMTAVYSEMLFNDASLTAWALAEQAGFDLTLLTATDLPWVADGIQRDGPHVREPVDQALRRALLTHGLPHQVIQGTGDLRTDTALRLVMEALSMRGTAAC